jgi:hypothetical protein
MGIGKLRWAAILFCATASGAGAQEAPSGPALPPPPVFQLPAGAKVRLGSHLMPGGRVEGRVAFSTDDSLGLTVASDEAPFGGGTIAVPRASVTSLQMSMGYRRFGLVGALAGAIAGAAAGTAATVDKSTCDSGSSDSYCSRGEAIAVSAAAGALLGAIAGHFIKVERWQNVSVEVLAPRVSARRPVPRGRGADLAAQVAIRF